MEQKYRTLEVGETLIEGDETYIPGLYSWIPTLIAGQQVIGSMNYRRPIPSVEQKYRMLEVGDTIQDGDEVWEFGRGPWEPVSKGVHGQKYGKDHHKMRRPVASGQCDLTRELKQQLDSLTKSWYDQRAELVDARNQITDLTKQRNELEQSQDKIKCLSRKFIGIPGLNAQSPATLLESLHSRLGTDRKQITDLTRSLEDALSDKVIAEAQIGDKDATIRRLKGKMKNVELHTSAERIAQLENMCSSWMNTAAQLAEDRDELLAWKNGAMIVDKEIDAVNQFVRNHPDAIIGHSVWDTVLKWLRERDQIKQAFKILSQG